MMSMCWCWNPWYRWWRLQVYKFLCDWDNNWKKREVNTTFLKLLFRMHPGWYTSYHVHQFSFLSGGSCLWHERLRCMDSKFQWGVKRKDSRIMRMLVLVCVLGYRWWQVKQVAESWCHQQKWKYGRCWKLFLELSSIFYRFCTYYC